MMGSIDILKSNWVSKCKTFLTFLSLWDSDIEHRTRGYICLPVSTVLNSESHTSRGSLHHMRLALAQFLLPTLDILHFLLTQKVLRRLRNREEELSLSRVPFKIVAKGIRNDSDEGQRCRSKFHFPTKHIHRGLSIQVNTHHFEIHRLSFYALDTPWDVQNIRFPCRRRLFLISWRQRNKTVGFSKLSIIRYEEVEDCIHLLNEDLCF